MEGGGSNLIFGTCLAMVVAVWHLLLLDAGVPADSFHGNLIVMTAFALPF